MHFMVQLTHYAQKTCEGKGEYKTKIRATWLHDYMAAWLHGYMATWLHG